MTDQPKHAGGRPSKYTPEMCDRVIEIGREGGIVSEMANACDVVTSTIYLWAEEHSEFSESLTRAQELAEIYWHEQIRTGLKKQPSEFQGAANLKYMAQRFRNWREKNETAHTDADGNNVSFTINMVPPKQ